MQRDKESNKALSKEIKVMKKQQDELWVKRKASEDKSKEVLAKEYKKTKALNDDVQKKCEAEKQSESEEFGGSEGKL